MIVIFWINTLLCRQTHPPVIIQLLTFFLLRQPHQPAPALAHSTLLMWDFDFVVVHFSVAVEFSCLWERCQQLQALFEYLTRTFRNFTVCHLNLCGSDAITQCDIKCTHKYHTSTTTLRFNFHLGSDHVWSVYMKTENCKLFGSQCWK